MFNSIALIAPQYKDKDSFVIRRIHELSMNENAFSDDDTEDYSLPTDAEIVCAVFCALLDYSTKDIKNHHSHFFDNNVTQTALLNLKENDFAIRNSQPR